MAKELITRRQAFYRPMSLENGRTIKNIIFYNDNGIICEIGSGFITKAGSGSIDLANLVIEAPIRRSKVNLTRKENFWIPTTELYQLKSEKLCHLYIYVDNKDVILLENKEEKEVHEYSSEKVILTYKNFFLTGESVYNEPFPFKVCVGNERVELDCKKEAEQLKQTLETKRGCYGLDQRTLEYVCKHCKVQLKLEK